MAVQAVAEKVIRIDVVTSAAAQANIKALSTQMAGVEKQAKQTKEAVEKGFGGIERAFSSVTRLGATLGIGIGFAEITRFVISAADSISVLESRMKLLFSTQTESNRAMSDIIGIASRTGREIDGVAKLYEKASRAGQQFGINQRDVAKITEGFSNSLRLSGASTQEAQASLIQFGQALASGRLQGDEFRSLVENNAYFMNEFAKATGKTLAELRKLGTEGKLSSDFLFDTMLKKGNDGLTLLERINAAAAKVPLTFAQSFDSLKTELTASIGEISKLFSDGVSAPQGFFSGAIDILQGFREELSRTRREVEAMDGGTWDRIWEFIKLLNRGADPASIATNGGKAFKDLDAAGRLENNIQEGEKRLRELQFGLKEWSEKAARDSSDFNMTNFNYFNTRVKEAEESLRKLKNLQNEETFGAKAFDIYMSAGGRSPVDPRKKGGTEEEDKKAQRAAEAAANATRDFLNDLQKRVELEEMLAKGTSITNEQLRLRQRLDELTAKSGGAAAKREGLSSLERLRKLEEEKKMQEFLTNNRVEEQENLFKSIEAMESQIKSDNAAIEAIDNKTKKTQEATTAQAEYNLEMAKAALFSLEMDGADEKRIALLKQYIDTLQRAIEKRNELEGKQKKAAQDKLDEADKEKEDAAFKRRVDQVTRSIVKGVGDGESFLKNIEDTLKNKVFEIILKPSIDPFSEALVKLADDFGKQLESILKDIFSQMGSSESGTGIGSLIGKGIEWISSFLPFANGGVMTSRGPLQLRKYARGGVANEPQIAMFGEGSTSEAYVPLPDGRNIPVKMESAPATQNTFQYNIAAGVTRAELMRAMETVRARTLNDVYKSGRRNGPIGGQ